MTSLAANTTYIFTVPPVSTLRDCNGTVVAMQFCYEYEGSLGTTINAFEFLLLNRDGSEATVIRSFTVHTTPLDSTCAGDLQGDVNRVCCSNATSDDFGLLQLPVSDFTFGISFNKEFQFLLLAFDNTVSEYHFDQFQVPTISPSPGTTAALTQINFKRDRSPPLLRFFIGKQS